MLPRGCGLRWSTEINLATPASCVKPLSAATYVTRRGRKRWRCFDPGSCRIAMWTTNDLYPMAHQSETFRTGFPPLRHLRLHENSLRTENSAREAREQGLSMLQPHFKGQCQASFRPKTILSGARFSKSSALPKSGTDFFSTNQKDIINCARATSSTRSRRGGAPSNQNVLVEGYHRFAA